MRMRILLFTLLVGSVATRSAPGGFVNWPAVPFTEVRAYYYNAEKHTAENEPVFSVLSKGKLHKSVVNKKGALLSEAQTKRLLAAVIREHRPFSEAMCYDPHHAFVFYKFPDEPSAVIDVCFGCMVGYAQPRGTVQYWDFPALAELVEELKLPLGPGVDNARQYRANFRYL